MFAIWFVIVSVVIGAMCAALWVVAP
jgi:hypothetical protein